MPAQAVGDVCGGCGGCQGPPWHAQVENIVNNPLTLTSISVFSGAVGGGPVTLALITVSTPVDNGTTDRDGGQDDE